MLGKAFLITFVLASSAAAQNIEEFMARIENQQGPQEKPCADYSGSHFAQNNRGCAWYFVCRRSEVVREDRCGRGLRWILTVRFEN